ncbi:M23 family metallopeptidase [Chachezhania antarctica]|uniref:M23 family metallopeptidase n=1 Tax=Chachezhania antarctica TaxID=2340860 RepID=UPI000EB58FF4|nr:M23 family metallopeptidase [Chachezhania antarctica]
MRTKLAIKLDKFLEKRFPERRVFLKSDTDTRFIRLKPATQLIAFSSAILLTSWAIIALAIVLMDSIGSGNFRDQAARDKAIYQARLNHISAERDARAEEAVAAQNRFNAALEQISVMQSELLESETRRHELATGIEVIQTTLRTVMKERDESREALTALRAETKGESRMLLAAETAPKQIEFMSQALARTAAERDQTADDAKTAEQDRDRLVSELEVIKDRNDQIFRQLEEAVEVSVEPLNKMFTSAGLSPDRMIEEVRRGYDGQGGPLMPISFSTRGEEPSGDELRANRILDQMDRLNLYRLAAEQAPFANPVRASVRMTSGFGYRRDPWSGGRRLHSGTDFAGPHGTNIYATADGVVTHAGWQSGYGKLVVIQHAFGLETRYAHNTRILVKKGQRVSRGDHISDMGSTGRSTGTHLHYEVRAAGQPKNPMIYIKAARNVF